MLLCVVANILRFTTMIAHGPDRCYCVCVGRENPTASRLQALNRADPPPAVRGQPLNLCRLIMTTSYSFPPADDMLALASTVADRLSRIAWKRRSLAGLDAVLTAVAVCHALMIRALPYIACAAAQVATIASTAAAPASTPAAQVATIASTAAAPASTPAAQVATIASTAAAPVDATPARAVPVGTVAQLRSMARARGLRTVDGRPVKYANRAQLLAVLA